MKKLSFLVMLVFSSIISFSQTIVKDHYTVSGGILGAWDYNKIRVTKTDNIPDPKFASGWSAGIWVNFPFSNTVSLEPQALYTSYGYKAGDNSTGAGLSNYTGNMDFISVPVLLKFHIGPKFAITAGPQFDFLTSIKDDNNATDKDNIKSTSTSLTAGLEFMPHGRLVIFGRYLHGITNLDNSDNPNTVAKFYNQTIQAGLKLRLFGKHIPADSDGDGISDPKDKCPSVLGLERYAGCPIPDTDGDGINDEVDKCVSVAGLAKYEGCPIPDKDKDGVNDEEDKCPDVAGLAKYQGCPIPDTDSDGINDEEDKCPSVAGLAKYQGCPIPDTDNDGINDEEDKCPDAPGIAEMKGCPKLEDFNASEVTFSTGKAVLTTSGKKELDLVVAYMERNSAVGVKLDGYTDNTGSDKTNIPLSEKRADAAKKYLVSKGIAETRITTAGHGSADPVADNKTAKGKATNRRVALSVQ